MAGIDKIYGTNEQYDEFLAWVKNTPMAVDMRVAEYFYPRDDYDSTIHRPITNFSETIDEWLLKNCTLPWVVDYIRKQYGMETDRDIANQAERIAGMFGLN